MYDFSSLAKFVNKITEYLLFIGKICEQRKCVSSTDWENM